MKLSKKFINMMKQPDLQLAVWLFNWTYDLAQRHPAGDNSNMMRLAVYYNQWIRRRIEE
jgi:hypothetical protein